MPYHAKRGNGRLATPLIAALLVIGFPSCAHAADSFDGFLQALQEFPASLLFITLVLSTLVSEDLTCIAAGLLAGQGVFPFLPAVTACLLGLFLGDILLYAAGRYLARTALRRPPLSWFIRYDDVLRCADWFSSNATTVILTSRFLPGTRLPTYVAAGMLRMPFRRFALTFLLAVTLWTPLLVGLAAWLGMAARRYLAAYERFALPSVIGLALLLWLFTRLILPLFNARGRRLLLSSWRRLTRWEFWPPWAFYPPVVLYILYLGIRYRGLTVFTAANPAIPAGGFIGESKADILDGLADDAGFVACYARLPAQEAAADRVRRVRDFMRVHGLDYPVVLKPDVGQRGMGVAIIRDADALEGYLGAMGRTTLLVQEFAPGAEFGVFYYRLPGAARGEIFSITEKRLPAVMGDGSHTLEQLILADDRAVCLARRFLHLHRTRLFDIPAAGERIVLTELGTHCRGALFLDGSRHYTEALRASIDHLSRKFTGFAIGRYDIRTPSIDAFRQGVGFKIVELNGVTAEATHIYDPGISLCTAQRVLRQQWSLTFAIGAHNVALGVTPTRLRELIQMLRRYEPCEAPRPEAVTSDSGLA